VLGPRLPHGTLMAPIDQVMTRGPSYFSMTIQKHSRMPGRPIRCALLLTRWGAHSLADDRGEPSGMGRSELIDALRCGEEHVVTFA
jgi:hypothetical protein